TTNYATSTLADLAQMLDGLAETALDDDSGAAAAVAGVEPWVRAFGLQHVETERPASPHGGNSGTWTVFAPPGHPLAQPLKQALHVAGIGDGVLLCLYADCEQDQVTLFLAAARAALAAPAGTRFVVTQHGRGAAGLAKTLHLEAPQVPTCVVDLADPAPTTQDGIDYAVEIVVAEAGACTAFTEVRYDADGIRTVPVLQLLPEPAADLAGATPLGP